MFHVFRWEQLSTSCKTSAVFLQDMKESRFHLSLKLRTRYKYYSRSAENRGSCSHEIAVMYVARETASTLGANVKEDDYDYEYVERCAEVTEWADDMRGGTASMSFTSAISRRFSPYKSESGAVLEVVNFMLEVNEGLESDPGEEKHVFLAVDDEVYWPCSQSFVSGSRTTEGRNVVLHTLNQGSTQMMLQILICGEC